MCKSYTEAPYLAPVLKSKPIIIARLCPEADPRDKLSQSTISFQLLFPEKSPKPKHRHGQLLTVDYR